MKGRGIGQGWWALPIRWAERWYDSGSSALLWQCAVARVAQGTERRPSKPLVAGSNPAAGIAVFVQRGRRRDAGETTLPKRAIGCCPSPAACGLAVARHFGARAKPQAACEKVSQQRGDCTACSFIAVRVTLTLSPPRPGSAAGGHWLCAPAHSRRRVHVPPGAALRGVMPTYPARACPGP